MGNRGIGNIIFWAGVLTVAFMWILNLPENIENIVFVAGLVATVVGALMRGGQFDNNKM